MTTPAARSSLYCDLIAARRDRRHLARPGRLGRRYRRVRSSRCVEELPTRRQRPTGFQGLPGPRGVADDLKKLTGVSRAIEKKLNDLGIFHYWQLAELDHDTAHHIGEEVGLPGRADGWVAQAKELAEAE